MGTFRKFAASLSLSLFIILAFAPAGCRDKTENTTPPIPTYEISGTITGPWTEGVMLTLTGAVPGSVRTDENGDYILASIPSGTYTLTPSLTGYTFTPAELTVVITDTSRTQNDFVSAPTLSSARVSGTAAYQGVYSGSQTRIYISLWKDGQPTGHGTSIASSGAYTIRSVPTGTYTLNAEMDILGTGVRNAVNPSGALPLITVTGDLAGQDIVLNDAVIAPPAAPTGLRVHPGNHSAIITWNGNASSREAATAYRISWGLSPGSVTSSAVIPAYGRQLYFQSIPDGAYSYLISALVGTAESAPAAKTDATIAAGSGASTVSGTITIPVAPTGPLYAGVYGGSGDFYFTRIASPSQTQSYSVSGIPGGAYQFFAVVDMNDNGLLDPGDVSIGIKSAYQLISVAGANVTWNATLPAQNATASVYTGYWQSASGADSGYNLKFEVDGNRKRPVAVTLIAGPHVPVPMDIVRPALRDPMEFSTWVKSGATGTVKPAEGDSYTYKVIYSDGTADILTASVSAVLDNSNLAQGLVVLSSPSRTVPTFTWQGPLSPPSSHTYALEVWPLAGSAWFWIYPQNASGMSSSQTSVLFNIDAQQDIPPALTKWVPYAWTVYVLDVNGNLAQSLSLYIP